jgi:hypothetical protein
MAANLTTWLLLLSLPFFALPGCANQQSGNGAEISIPEAMRVLTDVKSQAEQWTRTLKKDYPRGTPEHKKAEALYIPAKASIDAWAAALKADLTLGGAAPGLQFRESLKQAAARGNDYVVYVNQLYVQGATAPALPLIGELLKLLPDLGFKIWKEYRDTAAKRDEATKKAILEQIDTLKWESFDKL